MVRTIRFLVEIAFLATVVLFAVSDASRMAFAADEKKEEKKLELPKLPAGANPKWDFEAVEEKFTVIKGGINDNGYVYFLVELKEDMKETPGYQVLLIDSDGVKFNSTFTNCDPRTGKKGDRVRLIINGISPTIWKDQWIKTVKVQFVDK